MKTLKRQILDTLFRYTHEYDTRSGILKEPEKDEFMWAGDYDDVVEDPMKLFKQTKHEKD